MAEFLSFLVPLLHTLISEALVLAGAGDRLKFAFLFNTKTHKKVTQTSSIFCTNEALELLFSSNVFLKENCSTKPCLTKAKALSILCHERSF